MWLSARKLLCTVAVMSFVGQVTAAESSRQIVYINGRTYTIEYAFDADGRLNATPLAVQNQNGQWDYLREDEKGFVQNAATNGIPVTVDGKTYSVRFSTQGNKVGADVYAVANNGRWEYLSPKKTETTAPSTPSTLSTPAKSIATPAATNTEPIAEFQMYDKAVSALASTTTETTPLMKNGNMVYPNVTITARPRIQTGTHALNMAVDVDINGGSTSSGGATVLKRYTGATVNTQIDGHLTRDVIGTPDGFQGGKLKGNLDINYNVSTYTEFRRPFFAKRAHRRAGSQAADQAESQIPREKEMIRQQVIKATDDALKSSTEAMKKGITEASGLVQEGKTIPFHVGFSSQAPGDGKGFVSVALKAPKKEERKSRPEAERKQQAAAALYLHEDAINGIISPLLAGKKINLGEAMKIICDNNLTKKLEFCQKELDEKTENTTVLFDEENPFKISFQSNQIRIELNAVHSMGSAQGNPYKIEAIYDLSDNGLKRKSVKVTPRGSGQPELASNDKPKEPEHTGIGGFVNKAIRFFADPAEKSMLENAYGKAFKTEVEFPNISLPNGVKALNPKSGGTGEIVTASSYLPLEAKSQDGWFMASNYSCPSDGSSLGIYFQPTTLNGETFFKITQVVAGSPADNMGIKAGDKIRTYQRPGEAEKTPVASDFNVFQKLVSDLAANKETQKRLLTLEGTQANGQSFTKTVTLCPKGLDPVKEAKEVISKLK